MHSQNIHYLPGLDHLRGFAALLIVFYHGLHLLGQTLTHGQYQPELLIQNWPQSDNPLLALLYEGHTAVALFLVLSGFIFTYGSLGKHIIYHRFIINRLLRTYPLFVLLLLTGSYAFPERFEFGALLQTLFSFGNAHGAMDLKSFSAMFWAIAVEWQFYLIFPLLLLILQRDGAKTLLGMILVMMILRTLAHFEGANSRDLAYWTIIGRIDQFLLGMLAGVAYFNYTFRFAWPSLFLTSILVLGMIFGFHQAGGWPNNSAWKIIWPTLEGATWAMFILAYLACSQGLPAGLAKIMSWPGLISYSIYLLHFSVISIVIAQGWYLPLPLPPVIAALLNTLLWLPVILVLASLSYRYIEKPFLNLRLRYHR